MSDDITKWLEKNPLKQCHILSASINPTQCISNKKKNKRYLDNGWVSYTDGSKYKKAVYCSDICNGLDSKENISPDKATIS